MVRERIQKDKSLRLLQIVDGQTRGNDHCSWEMNGNAILLIHYRMKTETQRHSKREYTELFRNG